MDDFSNFRYVLVENQEKETGYTFHQEFKNATGIKALKPFEGQLKYSLHVEPGSTGMFIGEISLRGFGCGLMSREELHKSEAALIQQAIAEGKKQNREQNIDVYSFSHGAGAIFVYQN